MSRSGFECLRLGSGQGPEGARTPLILGPSALLRVLPRQARRRAATSADPHRTHHGEAAVSGARGSRFVRRREQLQQSELRRASAPPHSLPLARAAVAAAARPNRPSTAAALRLRGSLRAPPRAAGPAHLPSRPARAALCRRPRARPPRDYFPSPRPLHTTFFTAEGHARRRVTRPCESRAVIGPEPWRK